MRHTSQPAIEVCGGRMQHGSRMDYSSISILGKVLRFMDHNVEEAVHIQ